MVKEKEEHDKNRQDVDAATERINNERTMLNLMKNSLDVERDRLNLEKEKTEQLQSEVKVEQDHLTANMQSLETVKANLKELNAKKLENIYKHTLQLKANKEAMEKLSLALKITLADLDQVRDQVLLKNAQLLRGRTQLDDQLCSMVKQKEEIDSNREDVDAATESNSNERTTLNLMKNSLDAGRERLTLEKEKTEQLQSEVKVEQDRLMANMQTLETAKANLQEVNAKKLDNIYKNALQLKANKDGMEKISLTLKNMLADLDQMKDQEAVKSKLLLRRSVQLGSLLSSMVNQKEELDRNRQDVDAVREGINNERTMLNLMKNSLDAERERLTLEKEKTEQLQSEVKVEQDRLKANMQSLETVKANLQEVNEKKLGNISKHTLQLEGNKEAMEKLSLALKITLADLDHVRDQVLLKKAQLLRGRTQLDDQLCSMVKQKEELDRNRQDVDSATDRISNERTMLNLMKNSLDADRERLTLEKEKTEQLQSEVKVEQDRLTANMQSRETVKANLQQVNANKLENIYRKSLKLEANKEGMPKISLTLKNTLAHLDQVTGNVLNHNLILQRERIRLDSLLSRIKKQKEILDAPDRVGNERENLLSSRNNIETRQTEEFNEKSHHVDDDADSQFSMKMNTDVEDKRLIGKEKMEQLWSSFLKHNEEHVVKRKAVEDAMNTVAAETEKLLAITIDFDVNRRTVTENEKIKLRTVQKDQESYFMTNVSSNVTYSNANEERKNTIVQKSNHDVSKWGIKPPLQQNKQTENANDVQKHFSQIQESVKFESEMTKDSRQVNVQWSEASGVQCTKFSRAQNTSEFVRAKLKLLNQKLHDNFEEILHRLAQRNKYCLDLSKRMEDMCYELEQKLIISGYRNLIEQKTTHVVTTKSNKAIQTEVDSKNWQRLIKTDEIQIKDHAKYSLQNRTMTQTQFETKRSLEKYKNQTITRHVSMQSEGEYPPTVFIGDKMEKERKRSLSTQPESFAERVVSTVNKTSKRDCLRKIWKDTNMEKKEIDQMKCTGYEMRKHLEKQLKAITNFVQTYGFQKEKTFVKKKTLHQRFSTTWRSHSEPKHKTHDKRDFSLQELKNEMMCDIETLAFKK
ncbi:uncharacterized protein LOC144006234 [Festucalex cinctus]